DQFRRVSAYVLGFTAAPTGVDPHIAADDPTRLHECLLEGSDPSLKVRIVRSGRQQHADAPHALALLGVRGERPHGRTADERDELAPFQLTELHSLSQRKLRGSIPLWRRSSQSSVMPTALTRALHRAMSDLSSFPSSSGEEPPAT